jgi:hypothetical protein
MRLAPNTSSPAYLEAYVSTCMEAGVPEEVTAEHFHTLRVKEACVQSDEFAEGFEKEARGLYGAALEGGLRLLRGTAKSVYKPKNILKNFGREAHDWARIGAKSPFVSKAGLGADAVTTGVGGLMYAGSTGTGPLTGVDLNPFNNPKVPTTPSWAQLGPNGKMGVNPDGDVNSILQMRQQTKHIDNQIQQMQAQRGVLGNNLADRQRARHLENRISELEKARREFGKSFNSSFGNFERDNRKFQNQLGDSFRGLERGNSRLQGQMANLEDHYANTDNNWFQRALHMLPGVGADAQSDRLLARQKQLEEQYARAQQMQNQWSSLNKRIGY